MDQYKINRPEKIGTAVKLLYITLGIGALRSIMETSMYMQMVSPVFVAFFAIVIMWLFIHIFGKGWNWACITFLVLFIIGIPFSVLSLMHSLTGNAISGLFSVVQTIIQIAALVFLFQEPSYNWFKKMKVNKNA